MKTIDKSTDKTIDYYENNSQAFYARTINVDVTDSCEKFLRHLPKQACIAIDRFMADHIPIIVSAFNQIGWNKPELLFEEYLKEQEIGARIVWVAYAICHPRENGDPGLDSRLRGNDKWESRNNDKKVFAGYVTLKWQSKYPSFKAQSIPEIMDLNVLPSFRKMGIGSLLLDTAEKIALTKSQVIGIGVGLYAGEDGGYGAAQRLYVKRGYIPDGKGITYNDQPAIPGNSYPLDDDLVLWFTKKLR